MLLQFIISLKNTMSLPILRLKKNEDRRLRSGHLWIYSNEVANSLTDFTPGELVIVEASNNKTLGVAYVNPHSLICARLISHDPKIILDETLLKNRLYAALQLRETIFDKPFYRLVFAESDNLPGLIVDRYADILVLQITTMGMEKLIPTIVDILQKMLSPQAILLRNDSSIRKLENLELYVKAAFGEPPQHVNLEENGVKFTAPIWEGQKTGWFYDHRLNRARLKDYVKNKRVLDVFSYLGGWGIQAAALGAKEVFCLDSSELALNYVQQNAALNNVSNKVHILAHDAFAGLTQLNDADEKYDVIILDPPAFIKKRKDIKEGINAYHRINELALRLIANNGILISASCSKHLQRDAFLDILRQTSVRSHLHLQILEQGHQGPDHPVHPAMTETDYLKAFFTHVSH